MHPNAHLVGIVERPAQFRVGGTKARQHREGNLLVPTECLELDCTHCGKEQDDQRLRIGGWSAAAAVSAHALNPDARVHAAEQEYLECNAGHKMFEDERLVEQVQAFQPFAPGYTLVNLR